MNSLMPLMFVALVTLSGGAVVAQDRSYSDIAVINLKPVSQPTIGRASPRTQPKLFDRLWLSTNQIGLRSQGSQGLLEWFNDLAADNSVQVYNREEGLFYDLERRWLTVIGAQGLAISPRRIAEVSETIYSLKAPNGVLRKVIAKVDEHNVGEKVRSNELRILSVRDQWLSDSPQEISKISLYSPFYVFDERNDMILIGTDPAIGDQISPSKVIKGWVKRSDMEEWNTRIGLEWQWSNWQERSRFGAIGRIEVDRPSGQDGDSEFSGFTELPGEGVVFEGKCALFGWHPSAFRFPVFESVGKGLNEMITAGGIGDPMGTGGTGQGWTSQSLARLMETLTVLGNRVKINEVAFILDATVSIRPRYPDVAKAVNSLVTRMSNSDETAHFAMTLYKDEKPRVPFVKRGLRDEEYSREQDFTTTRETVQRFLNRYRNSPDGDDFDHWEAVWKGMMEAVEIEGRNADKRPDCLKTWILIGDCGDRNRAVPSAIRNFFDFDRESQPLRIGEQTVTVPGPPPPDLYVVQVVNQARFHNPQNERDREYAQAVRDFRSQMTDLLAVRYGENHQDYFVELNDPETFATDLAEQLINLSLNRSRAYQEATRRLRSGDPLPEVLADIGWYPGAGPQNVGLGGPRRGSAASQDFLARLAAIAGEDIEYLNSRYIQPFGIGECRVLQAGDSGDFFEVCTKQVMMFRKECEQMEGLLESLLELVSRLAALRSTNVEETLKTMYPRILMALMVPIGDAKGLDLEQAVLDLRLKMQEEPFKSMTLQQLAEHLQGDQFAILLGDIGKKTSLMTLTPNELRRKLITEQGGEGWLEIEKKRLDRCRKVFQKINFGDTGQPFELIKQEAPEKQAAEAVLRDLDVTELGDNGIWTQKGEGYRSAYTWVPLGFLP